MTREIIPNNRHHPTAARTAGTCPTQHNLPTRTPLTRRGKIIIKMHKEKIIIIIINKWNEIETKSNNEINKNKKKKKKKTRIKKITENTGFEPLTPDVQLLDTIS